MSLPILIAWQCNKTSTSHKVEISLGATCRILDKQVRIMLTSMVTPTNELIRGLHVHTRNLVSFPVSIASFLRLETIRLLETYMTNPMHYMYV